MLRRIPLTARDSEEAHRGATQLELFFDLVAVIAIAAATHEFRHALSSGHGAQGIVQFLMVFFLIWWPWQQYTWFSSSFDNDDSVQRLAVMVLMLGFMGIAASVPLVFSGGERGSLLMSYALMRAVQLFLWRRVAAHNPEHRATANRYSACLGLTFCYWVGLNAWAPTTVHAWQAWVLLGYGLELAVPLVANGPKRTPWHRGHIVERYGLMMIITLGEILLYSVEALRLLVGPAGDPAVLPLVLCGPAITFALWALYFSGEGHLDTSGYWPVFSWSYGHFLVFVAVAGVGTGLGVSIDTLQAPAHGVASANLGHLAISVPAGLATFGLWLVRDRTHLAGVGDLPLVALAVLIAVSGMGPFAPFTTCALLIAALAWRQYWLRASDRTPIAR
ncbi:MAG: low temperature requirement protein A [Pseudomonadota bacterium]